MVVVPRSDPCQSARSAASALTLFLGRRSKDWPRVDRSIPEFRDDPCEIRLAFDSSRLVPAPNCAPGAGVYHGRTFSGTLMRRCYVVIGFVFVWGSVSRAAAQWPPERTKNLKVFAADVPVAALLDTMATFTRALGVRCMYCHAGTEQQAFETLDFASDEKI